ncbi:E3 ubiquitin-protein ligase TRIM39-like [Sinocyclocheilus grahami]|uniref:E3 ubiquitin-protein ligase TRIM39-like n=1 Tax=Sinocyclocheilus grahami TaxID=75366 RepID=A0A672NGB5_SINGR|nr:PREDICTED: E3 ubiquitin-protein ligase TRIM39-like [Sinocyclocheilus grahami]XP_016151157.1 PREDICTED: E3 ubiquitin-protein ligase TRIM39-like [Sinocyclocheilus grahami]
MSLPGEFLSEEQFTCSICLDVFTNPVSIPCGHSFCSSCITSYWEGQGKSCFCPLCKESFRKRPELHINHTLKEITEQFKRMAEITLSAPRSAPADSPSLPFSAPKPGVQHRTVELPRGLLPEMKSRFQRTSSIEPLASHDAASLPPAKAPKRNFSVSGAGSNGPQCPRHGHSLELFCKTDQTCICVTCAEREHYGHSVIEAKREMNIKKSQLRILEVELQGLVTVRERKIEEIQTSLAEIQVNAEQEKAGTVSMFAELMKAVEKSQAELLEVVEMGQRAAELRSQAFIRELQMEISELRNRCSSLSQLTQSQDHVSFFKTYPAYCSLPVTKSWEEVALTPDPTAGAVLRNVTQMVEEVQEALRRLSTICLRPSTGNPPEIYQQKVWRVEEYAMDVTLDQDSAHPRLIISEDGKQVHCSDRYQVVPDTAERFDRVVCVLGRQGISSGCHYWEVVVGEKTDWDLGIASRSITRKGKIAANPANGFWFLSLRDKHEYVFRTEPSMPIVVQIKPQCVGVYVDYEKGQLSFYNADTKSLIFTFTDCFADTLYPFFSPCTNKSGKNEAPLIIYPAYPANPSWLTEK